MQRGRSLNSLIDNVFVLAMVGILAGALGGVAIGLVTGRTPSPTASTGTK